MMSGNQKSMPPPFLHQVNGGVQTLRCNSAKYNILLMNPAKTQLNLNIVKSYWMDQQFPYHNSPPTGSNYCVLLPDSELVSIYKLEILVRIKNHLTVSTFAARCSIIIYTKTCTSICITTRSRINYGQFHVSYDRTGIF